MQRGQLALVVGRDHEQRLVGEAHEIPEQEQARGVRPLQVVEHEDDALGPAEIGQERPRHVEERLPAGARVVRAVGGIGALAGQQRSQARGGTGARGQPGEARRERLDERLVGLERLFLERPSRTTEPVSCTSAANSATSRVLPTPGSPSTATSRPSPRRTAPSATRSRARGAARPTSGPRPRNEASGRGSGGRTTLSSNAAHPLDRVGRHRVGDALETERAERPEDLGPPVADQPADQVGGQDLPGSGVVAEPLRDDDGHPVEVGVGPVGLPAFRPTRRPRGEPPSATACCISTAQVTAGTTPGNVTISPSPRLLISWPPWRCITPRRRSRWSSSAAVPAASPRRERSAVEPTRSVNSSVVVALGGHADATLRRRWDVVKVATTTPRAVRPTPLARGRAQRLPWRASRAATGTGLPPRASPPSAPSRRPRTTGPAPAAARPCAARAPGCRGGPGSPGCPRGRPRARATGTPPRTARAARGSSAPWSSRGAKTAWLMSRAPASRAVSGRSFQRGLDRPEDRRVVVRPRGRRARAAHGGETRRHGTRKPRSPSWAPAARSAGRDGRGGRPDVVVEAAPLVVVDDQRGSATRPGSSVTAR